MNHLTSQLAVLLGPKCVTVNAILPGVFPSKMSAFGFSGKSGAAGQDALEGSHPMGNQKISQFQSPVALQDLTMFSSHGAKAGLEDLKILRDWLCSWSPEQVRMSLAP